MIGFLGSLVPIHLERDDVVNAQSFAAAAHTALMVVAEQGTLALLMPATPTTLWAFSAAPKMIVGATSKSVMAPLAAKSSATLTQVNDGSSGEFELLPALFAGQGDRLHSTDARTALGTPSLEVLAATTRNEHVAADGARNLGLGLDKGLTSTRSTAKLRLAVYPACEFSPTVFADKCSSSVVPFHDDYIVARI